jgi:hypothetical protein
MGTHQLAACFSPREPPALLWYGTVQGEKNVLHKKKIIYITIKNNNQIAKNSPAALNCAPTVNHQRTKILSTLYVELTHSTHKRASRRVKENKLITVNIFGSLFGTVPHNAGIGISFMFMRALMLHPHKNLNFFFMGSQREKIMGSEGGYYGFDYGR